MMMVGSLYTSLICRPELYLNTAYWLNVAESVFTARTACWMSGTATSLVFLCSELAQRSRNLARISNKAAVETRVEHDMQFCIATQQSQVGRAAQHEGHPKMGSHMYYAAGKNWHRKTDRHSSAALCHCKSSTVAKHTLT